MYPAIKKLGPGLRIFNAKLRVRSMSTLKTEKGCMSFVTVAVSTTSARGVTILRHHYLEIADGISRPEVAILCSC